MKRSRNVDEREFQVRSPRVESLLEDFGGADSVPSVPIASSERGADAAAKDAPTQNARIVLALRAAGCIPSSGKYLSRDAITERCELTVNAACGRLGPSGKLVIEAKYYTPSCCVQVVAVEDAAMSNAGLVVLGYQLTPFGVDRAAELARQDVAA